jgi:outer membrane protein assembly factor BamB
MRNRRLVVSLLAAMLPALAFGQSLDWPRWGGPSGTWVTPESDFNLSVLKDGPHLAWKANVGYGYSSVAVAGGKLFTIGLTGHEAACVCLDAATGAVVWKAKLPFDQWSGGEFGSTPFVDGDRVYCIGSDGTVFCLRSGTGAVLWSKGIVADYKGTVSATVEGASPVVDGALLLVNANKRLLAIDKMTGALVWAMDEASHAGRSWDTYETPVVAEFDGKRCVVYTGTGKVSIVELATGTVVWSFDHRSNYEIDVDPEVSGKDVFFSTHEMAGVLTVGASSPRWWTDGAMNVSMERPVLIDGRLYGMYWPSSLDLAQSDFSGMIARTWSFRCVDFATGKVLWDHPGPAVCTSEAGGKLLLLEFTGILHVVDPSPDGYKEILTVDVLGGAKASRRFVTPTVATGGRLYFRNYAGDLVCLDVRAGQS